LGLRCPPYGPAALAIMLVVAAVPARADEGLSAVQADWLLQARAAKGGGAAAGGMAEGTGVPTWSDAAGAVDGAKDGKYAFHTAQQPNPWWQVDLGRSEPIARIVVYNRLDYAPGLHNADGLLILTSDDGKAWTRRHDNAGKHFGGVGGAGEAAGPGPLEVKFEGDSAVRARYVRLQIPSDKPIYLHLDEVEVYGPADAKKNLALGRPADQSSVSMWSTAKVAQRGPAPVAAPEAYPIQHVIDRGRLLAADLRAAGVDTAQAERELTAAADAMAKLPADAGDPARRDLYFQARAAVRRLALANPLLNFDRLLFVKRFTQESYPDVCLNHMPWVSRPGGDICVLSRPFDEAPGKVAGLLNGALGPGHVHGVDLWWDADRVVFGYARSRTDQPPDGWLDRTASFRLRNSEQPTHVFEIPLSPAAVGADNAADPARARGIRQLTSGEWSDLDPTYLPSGEVAFVSERCGASLQCNEMDKDETSTNLYAMRGDGSRVRRLTVTKDGDYLPHTLDDGTIGYTRWEYQERGWAQIQSIWTVRPDGTAADALFKQHMNEPWALEDARSIPGSSKLVAIATGHHTLPAGPVVVVDPSVGMNSEAGIAIVTPGVRPPEGGMSGRPVPTGGVRDAGGCYMTPWPLSEKYFLVSYCYGGQTDRAGYAIYLIDVFGTKELIYRDPAISCFTPIPVRPRSRPPVLPDVTDPAQPYATCLLTDAAIGVDGIAPSRIRYLRIGARIPWPYDNTHGGQRYAEKAYPNNWTPVRVIGTVPVEPDGSAKFRVPTDTAVYFTLLDANQMELRRMRSFISFQPGEGRACQGCHETREKSPAPAGNSMAGRREPSEMVPAPWGPSAVSFLRDVQPILDRHCTRCHAGLKPTGGVDLSGGLTGWANTAFETIIAKHLVSWSNVQGDASITPPLAQGSHRSKMIAVLAKAPHTERVKLTEADRLRLVMWIDLNAPYHDGFINKRPAVPPYDLPSDSGLAAKIESVHARRCVACHKPADVSRLSWIDIQKPARTPFLAAPLPAAAGGSGRCKEPTYRDAADADYQALRAMVEAAVDKAWASPRRDLKALRRDAGAQDRKD
jgi:hypothetical protein